MHINLKYCSTLSTQKVSDQYRKCSVIIMFHLQVKVSDRQTAMVQIRAVTFCFQLFQKRDFVFRHRRHIWH